MDIATINQEIANLNVKFATVKDLDVSDENYTVGVSVIDSFSDLIDKIGSTSYSPDQIPQVLGILRGPVRNLLNDLKIYERRRYNMLVGEYEINKKMELEAQKAFDDLNNNQGQSFDDFLNQTPEVNQVEQQVNEVEQNLQKQKTLVLENAA